MIITNSFHTDGVSPGGEGADYCQAYKIDLGLRNAADLADWLLDHNLTKEQHTNLIQMLFSNDEESKILALEIINVKKQELENGTTIHSRESQVSEHKGSGKEVA